MSASIQIILAVKPHLAEGQFLLEQQTEHRKVSDMLGRNSLTYSFQNRRTVLRAKMKLNKEKCLEVTAHLT
jgi:hypothetical protein